MMVENRWGEGEKNDFFFVLCKWLVMWFTFVKSWDLLMLSRFTPSPISNPHFSFCVFEVFILTKHTKGTIIHNVPSPPLPFCIPTL